MTLAELRRVVGVRAQWLGADDESRLVLALLDVAEAARSVSRWQRFTLDETEPGRQLVDALARLWALEHAGSMTCVEDGSHSDDLSHEAEYRAQVGRHASTRPDEP